MKNNNLNFNLDIFSEAAKEAALSYLKKSGTVRRGLYKLSEEATDKLDQAYISIAKLIHFEKDEIMFVSSPKTFKDRIVKGPFKTIPTGFVDISSILHRELNFDQIYLKGSSIGVPGLDIVAMKKQYLKRMEPIEYGGDMVSKVTKTECTYAEIPYRFSAGTPDIASIIALGAAANEYAPNKDIDKVSSEFKKYLELQNINFEYFELSNCFLIDSNKEDKKFKNKEIYIPRIDSERIWILKGML